jgi:N-acetylglucosaminyldiphosphoundecaprenol N-acetyl-beta-D-mannosaminyltransferase
LLLLLPQKQIVPAAFRATRISVLSEGERKMSTFIQTATQLTSASGAKSAQVENAEQSLVGYAQVLGVKVSAVNMADALRIADDIILRSSPSYICLTGVHGVMEAQDSADLMSALNHAAINLPDGMPMTWVGHLQGHRQMDRVFGPDFMIEMCRLSVERKHRHFLYGGEAGVVEELKLALEKKSPGVQIVGTFTPPFRDLTADEMSGLKEELAQCRADVLWIGISTPRQECFMAQHINYLKVPLMVGVGAAFDYHTGRIRDCAPWIKRAGLQWLHRLLQDPRRLWRRYLKANPGFLWKITVQLFEESTWRRKAASTTGNDKRATFL